MGAGSAIWMVWAIGRVT